MSVTIPTSYDTTPLSTLFSAGQLVAGSALSILGENNNLMIGATTTMLRQAIYPRGVNGGMGAYGDVMVVEVPGFLASREYQIEVLATNPGGSDAYIRSRTNGVNSAATTIPAGTTSVTLYTWGQGVGSLADNELIIQADGGIIYSITIWIAPLSGTIADTTAGGYPIWSQPTDEFATGNPVTTEQLARLRSNPRKVFDQVQPHCVWSLADAPIGTAHTFLGHSTTANKVYARCLARWRHPGLAKIRYALSGPNPTSIRLVGPQGVLFLGNQTMTSLPSAGGPYTFGAGSFAVSQPGEWELSVQVQPGSASATRLLSLSIDLEALT